MRRVVITGIGAICGNASNKEELYDACINGISGIKKTTAFDAAGLMTEYFGENSEINVENRLNDLINSACTEMLHDAGTDREQMALLGKSCRLFYGTLLSNSDYYYKHSMNKLQKKSVSDCLARMNEYAAYARNILGIRGGMSVSSAACAAGTTAIGMALEYIRNGICEVAVAGGADPLTIVAAYGFNALKTLSNNICNPYDENRDGINIGECGAFFMIETLEHAVERGAKIYCELLGYGLGNDAYHITSPEPEGNGAYNTMCLALKDGNVVPDKIQYINGHGTGTPINDAMEMKAINKVFNQCKQKPAISSTKALIGHCMGASGAIELASVIMAMNHGKYIPMPKLDKPVGNENGVFASSQSCDMEINYALSNSFAFAGNGACILVKRYDGGASE